jgi:hypothetical protein
MITDQHKKTRSLGKTSGSMNSGILPKYARDLDEGN